MTRVYTVPDGMPRLTALGAARRTTYGKWLWHYRCACGNEFTALKNNVAAGKTTSCGCARRQNSKKVNWKHGGCKNKSFSVWYNMLQRCENSEHRMWKHYGQRGITVCDRWKSYENFRSDMGEPPDGMELDRIDNDGHYSIDNCRWSTRSQQNRNKRNTLRITLCGERRSLADACDLYRVDRRKVADRARWAGVSLIESFLSILEDTYQGAL